MLRPCHPCYSLCSRRRTGTELVAVGNRTKLTDPNGNATTWVYDNLNRVTSETNALSDSRSYSYDAVGNVIDNQAGGGQTHAAATALGRVKVLLHQGPQHDHLPAPRSAADRPSERVADRSAKRAVSSGSIADPAFHDHLADL
ncbi:MAG: hypothetical protein FJ276_12220, partial [Planctomycetes bacterium]|nr:hypothetical protein [Planctomycetota bacterium]